MAKKLDKQEGVDLSEFLAEEAQASYNRGLEQGIINGRQLALEEMKRILSSARLTHDIKTQVWYLIDECQKNQ